MDNRTFLLSLEREGLKLTPILRKLKRKKKKLIW
jgi:hypothetical protein